MSVAREGWPLIIPPTLVGVGLVLAGWHWVGAFFLLTALGVAFFFRDPHRAPSPFSGAVVSPADGRIVTVVEIDEPDYLRTPGRRISVFMSLFNVHINYAPVTGQVEFLEHRKGVFRRAYLPEASVKNENNSIGIRSQEHRLMVRQIAGTVARRIVCRLTKGDRVQTGEKIGLIRFGSRVDVFLPLEWEVLVKEGDRVKGGITQLARIG
jgi:phosphatidylserine decarboxylase